MVEMVMANYKLFYKSSPRRRDVCCRCPPDKGDTPEGGRGFVFKSLPPKGGVPSCFPVGNETGSPSAESPKEGVRRRCPPDKGDPPEGGRGFVFKSLPPKGGVPLIPPSGEYVPKGGGFVFVRGSHPASLSGRKPPLIPPYQGGKKLSPFGVALLPCQEWNPPLNPPRYQGGSSPLSP